jgi:hypothetical protein
MKMSWSKPRSRKLLASARTSAALTLCVLLLVLTGPSAIAQNGRAPRQDAETVGVPSVGAFGVERTTADLMAAQAIAPPSSSAAWRMMRKELELPDRRNLPQDSNAAAVASTPVRDTNDVVPAPRADFAQTVSLEFTAATLADTGAFPPDSMGAVGPTQFFLFVNGRLRTFNKTTGVADAVINIDPDVFFATVMTPPPGPTGLNFTSDPQVRYDRLTQRWILTIIDVPSTSSGSIGDTPNRLLIAVSDAASAGVITGGTVWTFYFVQQDTVGGIPSTNEFLDYDSLGVDANALYVGGNMFNATTSAFTGTSAWVIRKSSILSGGPVVTTAFRGLITGGDGPDSPRGVDNFDPAATEGYVIGTSDAAFGRLIMRRIGTPGGTPTISANIAITVAATSFPIPVNHFGNTGGNNGRLDALDDRLFAAHIRNGRLWTAHNIAVTSAGVASGSDAQRRDGARWYELIVPPGSGTPTVNQSGTVFGTAALVADARQFWIPTVTVSGQGHAAFGFSTAGTPFHAEAATTGRLAGDALGTLDGTQIYSDGPGTYNPPADPGGASGRRWGDYSFVSLDPNDDMTMWAVQEFCNATNSYGVSVAKLLAPPPAMPSSASPSSMDSGSASTSVTITGTSSAGSGFFDPGPGFANRLTASVTGGVIVNSATYVNPTTVTLNVSTVSATAGSKNVTITNPDGQALTGIGILSVFPPGTPPSITTQPLSQTIASGSTATMSVIAGGSATLTYQWYVGPSGNTSSPIGGATSSSFTTPPLTTTTSYWVRVSNSFGTADSNTATITVLVTRSGDFDGDGKDDPTIYRPSTGLWAILKSSTGYTTSTTVSWGLSTDVPRAGDYDGDGKTDPAIYRPSTGLWAILKSSTGYTTSMTVSWGLSTDLPIVGDFDGDGKADPAIYRPSTGLWAILQSSTGYTTSMTVSWGLSTDLPVPGDYDGDGKSDPAIFRPSTGLWAILQSSTSYTTSITVSWGLSTDVAVPGDYDGDGKIDPAVYRPSTGFWYILKSSTGYSTSVGVSWGLSTDNPVPADFDGDGKTDPAIFRPSTGLWALLKSSTGYSSATFVSWGLSTDVPIYRRP